MTLPSKQQVRIPKATASAIMEVVEGACNRQLEGITAPEAAKYAGISSEEYARKALDSATQLGMLTKTDQKYYPTNDISDFPRASKEQKPFLFRKFLQRFDPFILFASLLGRGNLLDQAARKVGVIYSVEAGPESIRFTLSNWGEYAQIIEAKKGKIVLKIETPILSAEYIRELLEAMEHDIKARMYIATKLGDNVFGYMRQDEIDFLVKSIRTHQKSPRNSIDDAGRAFEDFLRRVLLDKEKDASDCKGITELAERMKGEKLVDQKQLEICRAIGSIRVAAAHSLDRLSNEAWTINPDAAIETILLTITMIRSVHVYVFLNIQTF